MTIERLSDPAAVEAAIAEFDRVGRTEFLAKYGFGRALYLPMRRLKNF